MRKSSYEYRRRMPLGDKTPLLYQCPGCWITVTRVPPEDGWMECNCGERMTLIDLRARTDAGAHEGHWWEDEK